MTEENPQIVEDRSLARRVASGDQVAFDAFFREYFPRLFRFTLSRVDNDSALAEEIVQRTMCIVVRKIGSYRGEALLFTWLCQICRNETSSLLRKLRLDERADIPIEDHPAVQAALESAGAEDPRPDTLRLREEIGRFVRVTLEHLPSNYATALEMKYMQGSSVAEIAASLGVGEKAAESVLSRARKEFRERFQALWSFEPDIVLDG